LRKGLASSQSLWTGAFRADIAHAEGTHHYGVKPRANTFVTAPAKRSHSLLADLPALCSRNPQADACFWPSAASPSATIRQCSLTCTSSSWIPARSSGQTGADCHASSRAWLGDEVRLTPLLLVPRLPMVEGIGSKLCAYWCVATFSGSALAIVRNVGSAIS
jgi:hypothetical protein